MAAMELQLQAMQIKLQQQEERYAFAGRWKSRPTLLLVKLSCRWPSQLTFMHTEYDSRAMMQSVKRLRCCWP